MSRIRCVRELSTSLLALCLLGGLASLPGCSGDEGVSKPAHRTALGVVVNPAGRPGHDPSMNLAYDRVMQGGFSVAQFGLEWGEVEDRPGERDWGAVDPHVHRGLPIPSLRFSVELLLIDAPRRGSLPEDLEGAGFAGWDDSLLRQRLLQLIVDLEERMSGRLAYVWIGKEVDVYFASHGEELGDFVSLLSTCRDSLATRLPALALGTILSYGDALEGGRLGLGDSLAPAVSRLGLDVYGRDPEYVQTLDPRMTVQRIRDAVSRYPQISVVLTEVGFPGTIDPQDTAQPDFAQGLTGLLGDAPENLECAVWFCLHDWYHETAAAAAAMRFPDDAQGASACEAQLRTLGLHDVNGVRKPAFSVLSAWTGGPAAPGSSEGVVKP